MKLKKKEIIIPSFNFYNNNNFKDNLDNLEIEVFKNKLVALKKFLKLKKKSNFEKGKIENKSIESLEKAKLDFVKLLENEKNQKKIIKVLSNYNKIPRKIINYFKKNLDDDITNEMIINKMLEYMSLKYNEMSILDFDIDFILFDKKYLFDEEGPREYILNELKNNKEKGFCIIS